MSADTEVSKGIVTNPRRLGGKATVKGTRVTAEMVAMLMAGPDAPRADWIIRNYPSLTYADLTNVRAWDRRGRPA